jgi:hypothetical protein
MTCLLVNKLMQAIIQHESNFDSYQHLCSRKRRLNAECGRKPHVGGCGIGKILKLHIRKANKRMKDRVKNYSYIKYWLVIINNKLDVKREYNFEIRYPVFSFKPIPC